MSAPVFIVIPTYNEAENIHPLVRKIHQALPDASILFVDDRSTDQTGEQIQAFSERDQRVLMLRRSGPRSFSQSCIEGYRFALDRGAEWIVQMDADLSHDPAFLPSLLERTQEADVILGSRYVGGTVSVLNWPLRRLMLSAFANFYVRTITRMRAWDCTTGFHAYRAEVLRKLSLEKIQVDGYAFQVEILFRAYSLGARIVEVPIVFSERRRGASKMAARTILESMWVPWRLQLQKIFGRLK